MADDNIMRKVKLGKITLNIGTGKEQDRLEKGLTLIKYIVGKDGVKTFSTKRIPNWGLRKGLPIGCKITLRGKEAEELLPRLLYAKSNILETSCFDNNGNVSFGIPEYIDIKDVKYNPEIGIIGLEVSITLERAGFRVKRRKIRPGKIPLHHRISPEDSMKFMKEKFNIKIGGEKE